jgi:hypothetical protein
MRLAYRFEQLLYLNQHSTKILAEVSFLLILIAGLWFVASEIPALRMSKARRIVAGIALAIAGILLIIATHWGKLG